MMKRNLLRIAVISLLAWLACSLGSAPPSASGVVEKPPQDRAELDSLDYEVVSITTLTTNGGRVDWSHDGQWIYYDRLEPDGFWDVYRIHPDGTGNECLTCDRPELPNGNQGQPQIHPNGRYLVFQAEKAEHAGPAGAPSTGPGRGCYNDLWVLDLETGDFHQLTDVRSGIPMGGSLHAHFSNDGTKLLWSDLEGSGGRFGDWRLAVADFVTSPSPHLENHRYYNPGPQPIWLEAHGWGPDDSWIYFTCTPVAGMDDNNQDICRMDFSSPTEVTRLTFTSGLNGEPGEWDEHAHLSPLNDVFSWMSSSPYGTESSGSHGQWLQTELWLMDTDGSNRRRITFFNEAEQVVVADNDWNPAATGNQQLAVTMFMRDRNEVHIKIIEFAAANGPYWPSFGYDRRNTGHSPHLGPGPGPVEMAWLYPAVKGRVINQQQTVNADGTIYFATWGAVDEEAEDYAHGLLYALNPDGTLKWVYDPGPADCPLEKTWCYGTIETSPVIGPDDTIYIGRGDGILRAVNPDGTLKWSFETIPNTKGRGQIISSPAVSRDGVIYFGTIANLLSQGFGNNVFYAVKDMGDHAELLWTYPEDAAEGGTLDHEIWGNPAIGLDGTVYFSVGRTVYAFWPDGTERWHKTTLYKMYTPVVGPDGTIYVQATGTTGVVYALNPDGTKKWTYAVGEGETTVSNVSIGPDGTLYVGSGTREDQATPDIFDEPQNIGKLYALVDAGDHAETKWVVDFGSSVGAPAIDGGGIIYAGLRGDLNADPPVRGRVVALRDTGDSGEILWSVEARGELWLGKPVIGANRALYFADAVCMDYETCDEDTDVPAVYAVRPARPSASQVYLPLAVANRS